jgi:hypothetical protein
VSKTSGMSTGQRWLAVGHSADLDPRRAGREAAQRALGGSDPALLLVFCSDQPDPARVLEGIEEVCPGVPLIGCSSHAVVASPDGLHTGGVAVTAFGGPGFSVCTAQASSLGGAQRAAGAQVAACATDRAGGVPPVDLPHRVMLLLTDGSIDDQEEVIAGAYSVLGASAPLIGGVCGPDRTGGRMFQLHGREVSAGSVVGALVTSDGPFGVGVRHGCRKVGEPMLVTRAVGGNLYTLDDQPALHAYLDRLNAPPEAYTEPAVFDRFSRPRPIGIRRRSGEEVRHVNAVAGLTETTLRSRGEVPEGGLIWVMEGDHDSVLEAAGEACHVAIGGLGGAEPLGLIAFDCLSRSRMLGEEGTADEAARLLKEARGAPVAGLYTWGEIARTRGINGYHNQTLAVLAVG